MHTILAIRNVFVRTLVFKKLNLISKQFKEKRGIYWRGWLGSPGRNWPLRLGAQSLPVFPSFSPVVLDSLWKGADMWPKTILGWHHPQKLAECISSKIAKGQKSTWNQSQKDHNITYFLTQFFPKCRRGKGEGPLQMRSELLGMQSISWENERDIVAGCLQWVKGLNQVPVEEFP